MPHEITVRLKHLHPASLHAELARRFGLDFVGVTAAISAEKPHVVDGDVRIMLSRDRPVAPTDDPLWRDPAYEKLVAAIQGAALEHDPVWIVADKTSIQGDGKDQAIITVHAPGRSQVALECVQPGGTKADRTVGIQDGKGTVNFTTKFHGRYLISFKDAALSADTVELTVIPASIPDAGHNPFGP